MPCLNQCSKVSLQAHFETDTIPERDCIYFNIEQKQTRKSILPFPSRLILILAQQYLHDIEIRIYSQLEARIHNTASFPSWTLSLHSVSWNLIHDQDYCAQINNNMITALKNHRLKCQNNVHYYHIAGIGFLYKKDKMFLFCTWTKAFISSSQSYA